MRVSRSGSSKVVDLAIPSSILSEIWGVPLGLDCRFWGVKEQRLRD